MKFPVMNRQCGLSAISMIFLIAIGCSLAIVGARVVPSISEFVSVKKVAKQAATQAENVHDLRETFDRLASVNYVSSITGKDLTIREVNGKYTVNFSYDKEIHLVGPAYLLLKYEGSTSSTSY